MCGCIYSHSRLPTHWHSGIFSSKYATYCRTQTHSLAVAATARIHPKSITCRDFRPTPGIYHRHAVSCERLGVRAFTCVLQIIPPQFKNADVIAVEHAGEPHAGRCAHNHCCLCGCAAVFIYGIIAARRVRVCGQCTPCLYVDLHHPSNGRIEQNGANRWTHSRTYLQLCNRGIAEEMCGRTYGLETKSGRGPCVSLRVECVALEQFDEVCVIFFWLRIVPPLIYSVCFLYYLILMSEKWICVLI